MENDPNELLYRSAKSISVRNQNKPIRENKSDMFELQKQSKDRQHRETDQNQVYTQIFLCLLHNQYQQAKNSCQKLKDQVLKYTILALIRKNKKQEPLQMTKQEIQNSKKQLASLEKSYKNELEKLRQKITSLQQDNNNQSQFIAQLLRNLDTVNQENQNIKRQKEKLEKNINLQRDTKKELEISQKMYQQCQVFLTDRQMENNQLKNQIKMLKDQMIIQKKRHQQQIQRLNYEINIKNKSVLKERNLQSTLIQLKKELQTSLKDKEFLKKKELLQNNKIDQLNKDLNDLMQENKMLKQSYTKAKQEIQTQKLQLSMIKNRNSMLEKQLEQFKNKKEKLDKQLHKQKIQHLEILKRKQKDNMEKQHLLDKLRQYEGKLARGNYAFQEDESEITPQEVIAYVKDFWKNLKQPKRLQFKRKLSQVYL